jgi:hypothetical protein
VRTIAQAVHALPPASRFAAHARQFFRDLTGAGDFKLRQAIRPRCPLAELVRPLESHREFVLHRPDPELVWRFARPVSSHVPVTSLPRELQKAGQ